MQGRVRWQRITTLANLVVAALVILVLYGTLLALSVLAPEISGWQLLTLLAIGVPISVVGLWLAKNLGSRAWRWLGLIINGAPIALYAAIIHRNRSLADQVHEPAYHHSGRLQGRRLHFL